MTDTDKTSEQLLDELQAMRGRVSELEASGKRLESDVAKGQQVEDALRKSEELYRNLIETTAAVGWEVDIASQRFTYIGPQVTKISGFPPEEWVDFAFWAERIDPEDRERALSYCETETAKALDHAFEYRMRTADGRTIWIRDVVSVITQDGRPVALRGFFIDVTATKAAEEAQRKSEQWHRALFELSRDALMTGEPLTGRFTSCNPAAVKLFGTRDEPDFLARPPWEYSPERQPDGRPSAEKAPEMVGEALRKGSHFFEWTHRTLDGRDFPATVLLTRMDIDGEPMLQATVRDETETKRLQAGLAQSDRLASMGMLAAGVAHEINNPLTHVLFNVESLNEDFMGPDTAQLEASVLAGIRQRCSDAMLGTRRIKDVASRLGAFSRVEPARVAPVDLAHVIEVATSLAFNEIRFRARLAKEYGKTSAVMADDGRLSQVFLNLLVNAAHAIPEGDVDNHEIGVRTWQKGDQAFAEVRDTGEGVAEERLRHLFEPFYTTKQIGVGTGLGLSISKSIVESFGGQITVSSKIGEGTSFVVCLPTHRADTEHHDEPVQDVPDRRVAGVSGRILVVDDEAGIRAAIARMLKGHVVVQTSSAEEARTILTSDHSFDVILCDVMMPGMSGPELHEWLVLTYPALAERVVFVTGGAFTPRAREHLSKHRNIQLSKPFEVAEFRKVVNELVHAAKGSKGA